MTPRHTGGQADHVPDARRGAMYMRAEARRAAESGVATTSALPRRRRDPRRTQLAVLALLWLVVAAVTVLVGVYWRGSRQATPAAVTAAVVPSQAAPASAAPTPPRATAARPAPVVSAAASAAKPVTPVAPPPVAAPRAAVPVRPSVATVSVPAARPVHAETRASRAAPAAPDARLVITTSPAGALVTVDGIGWGATPAKIRYLPPGTKHVRVTKDGYASQERSVEIGGAGTATLRIALRPLAATSNGRPSAGR